MLQRYLPHIVLLCCACWLAGTPAWPQPAVEETWVSVTVTTLNGSPALLTGQLTVVLQDMSTPAHRIGTAIRDDAHQRITILNVFPGQFRLVVQDRGRSLHAEQVVTLHTGDNEVAVPLPLHQLEVQCTQAGRPVRPRTVAAFFKPPQITPNNLCPRLTAQPGGSVLLDDVPEAGSVIVLTELGYATLDITIPPDLPRQTVTVPLLPGAVADITVQDSDGARLANTPFAFVFANLGLLTLHTDSAGQVRDLHLPPGSLRVQPDTEWINTRQQEYRMVPQPLATTAGARVTATVLLAKRQTLTGRCTVDGKPVAPTRGIFFLQYSKSNEIYPWASTWANGRVQVQMLFPEENHWWLLTDLGYGETDARLPITQRTIEATFPLSTDGGIIDVTMPVTGEAGQSWLTLRGRLPGQEGRPITITCMPDTPGHWRTPQIPPGAWILHVQSSQGQQFFTRQLTVDPHSKITIAVPK